MNKDIHFSQPTLSLSPLPEQVRDRAGNADRFLLAYNARRNPEGTPQTLQGNLAHKTTPIPQGFPYDLRYGPAVGSYGVAFSWKGGTPVLAAFPKPPPQNPGRNRLGEEGVTERFSRGRRSGKQSFPRFGGLGESPSASP